MFQMSIECWMHNKKLRLKTFHSLDFCLILFGSFEVFEGNWEIQLIDEISTVLAWRKLLLRCSIYRKAHIDISIIDISIIDISTLFKNIDIDKVTFENIDIIAWQKLLLQWTAWEGLNQVNFPTIWSLLFVFGFLYWSSQIQRNIV